MRIECTQEKMREEERRAMPNSLPFTALVGVYSGGQTVGTGWAG
jgi:hypothetical protein